MKRVLNIIKDNLDISMKEAKSVLAFLSLVIICYIIFKTTDYYTSRKDATIVIEQLTPDLLEINDSEARTTNIQKNKKEASYQKFKFDPNKVSKDDLIKLGFPIFVANNIIKYREKGGKFKSKSDLMKIYNMPPKLFSELTPYIDLPDEKKDFDDFRISEAFPEEPKESRIQPSKNLTEIVTFDLNKADTNVLKRIPGIGSVLSNRIVKFRIAVGGFYDVNQLNEVYGLKDEALAEIKKYATIDAGIRKIEINIVKSIKHPYLTKNQAAAIISYRNQHGNFEGIADLEEIKILDEKTIQKISPYLNF